MPVTSNTMEGEIVSLLSGPKDENRPAYRLSAEFDETMETGSPAQKLFQPTSLLDEAEDQTCRSRSDSCELQFACEIDSNTADTSSMPLEPSSPLISDWHSRPPSRPLSVFDDVLDASCLRTSPKLSSLAGGDIPSILSGMTIVSSSSTPQRAPVRTLVTGFSTTTMATASPPSDFRCSNTSTPGRARLGSQGSSSRSLRAPVVVQHIRSITGSEDLVVADAERRRKSMEQQSAASSKRRSASLCSSPTKHRKRDQDESESAFSRRRSLPASPVVLPDPAGFVESRPELLKKNRSKSYSAGNTPVRSAPKICPATPFRKNNSPHLLKEQILFRSGSAPRSTYRANGAALLPPPHALSFVDPDSSPSSNGRLDEYSLNSSMDISSSPPSSTPVTPVGASHKYERLEHIGRGSFGNVWKARNLSTGQIVALKISTRPFRSTGDMERAQRQMQLLARLHDNGVHPHLLHIIECWQEQGHYFIESELCERGTLDTFFSDTVCNEDVAWRCIYQLADGLARMHDCNIVHMDIKPENIYVTSHETMKIGDFGIAVPRGGWPNMDIEEGDQIYLAPEFFGRSERPTPPPLPAVSTLSATFTRSLPRLYASSSTSSPSSASLASPVASKSTAGSPSCADFPADIYALGLTLYEQFGEVELPSNGPLWQLLRSGSDPLDFSKARFPVSDQIKTLIRKMIDPIPERRPTAHDILDHPKVKILRLKRLSQGHMLHRRHPTRQHRRSPSAGTMNTTAFPRSLIAGSDYGIMGNSTTSTTSILSTADHDTHSSSATRPTSRSATLLSFSTMPPPSSQSSSPSAIGLSLSSSLMNFSSSSSSSSSSPSAAALMPLGYDFGQLNINDSQTWRPPN